MPVEWARLGGFHTDDLDGIADYSVFSYPPPCTKDVKSSLVLYQRAIEQPWIALFNIGFNPGIPCVKRYRRIFSATDCNKCKPSFIHSLMFCQFCGFSGLNLIQNHFPYSNTFRSDFNKLRVIDIFQSIFKPHGARHVKVLHCAFAFTSHI